MIQLFVADTNAIISYFYKVFEVKPLLSSKAMRILDCAFNKFDDNIKLSIPSVVFIEIFEKWFISENFVRMFYYEIYYPIIESPNIEIKPLEREVLNNLVLLRGDFENHELNDKIILASALMLNCPLITCDQKIIKYVNDNKLIPSTIQ